MVVRDCIKVLVCHEDPLCQAGLLAALRTYSDVLAVDGAASTPTPQGAHAAPDVVVAGYHRALDLATTRASARTNVSPARILVVTGLDCEWSVRKALARGVHGYLSTGFPLDELARAVRAVHRGERYLSAPVAARLAEHISLQRLTAREEEVLRLVTEGLCNKSIARQLGITVGTVKSHLRSTFEKLNVTSRTQAVANAERRGLFRGADAVHRAAAQA